MRNGMLGLCAMLLTAPAAAAAEGAIPFSHDLERALERAASEAKPVVLAFGAVWCPSCRYMEQVTLPSPEVQALADRFVWVSIDIDRNLSLARDYGVDASPYIFLLDAQGRTRQRIVGAGEPEEFAAILGSFLESLAEGQPAPGVEETAQFRATNLTFTPKGHRARALCFSHVGYGPLHLSSQSPLQSLRLALTPRTPSTLGRGQFELRAVATWANLWAIDSANFFPEFGEYGPYYLDYETLDATVSVAYGVSDVLQVEGGFENRNRFGGAMDGFIQGFHDLFGLDQNGRDRVPKDQHRIVLDPGDGRAVVDVGSEGIGTFSRAVELTIQHNVSCGGRHRPALAWSVTGRYGLHADELEGSPLDVALSLSTSRRLGEFYVYGTLGYARYGSDRFRGLELRDSQLSGLVAGEWRFRPRMSVVFQWLASQGAVDEYPPFSKPSHEVTVGWKGEIADLGVLELGLLENVITFDNSPDFGIHVGYAKRF